MKAEKKIRDSLINIKNRLMNYNSFLLTTHLSPDGDGIGAILALGLTLRKLNKDVEWLVLDPIPNMYKFLPSVTEIKSSVEEISDFNKRQIIIIDSSDLERVGGWTKQIDSNRQLIFNLDHHISNTNFGDFQLVNSEAASVCELIYSLIVELDQEISRDVATCLLTGLITDTGCFRFSNTTTDTFELAIKLINLGGEYRKIITNVYETKSYQEVLLLGKTLNTLVLEKEGRLAWLVIDLNTIRNLGIDSEQTESIVNLARNIEGVKLAILFKQVEDGVVKVSFRSREDVDVAKLALEFGGGGHPRASGCSLKSTTLQQAQELVLNKARKLFD
ncbi:MAG TPA: bifunctional oligoribonuclease/PAP phosphatase NrnA [Clostridia bacterium]|nr:bifunctional oligoribonuclease/PAP phosphatase NrnA [Clostridia bacterium]